MSELLTSQPEVADCDSKLTELYQRAFAAYRTRALWNLRQFEVPTVGQALLVARHLRIEGDMQARRLAEQIEKAASADL
jgi:hypothetical protein